MSGAQGENGVSLLENMLLIRAYEAKNVAEQAAGRSPGTCTSVGQEASAVGVVRALGPDDLILTNHRSAGHLLARGADPGRMFAEVRGKKTGYCKGKSGNLHISVKELGVILTSTIVGGELSLVTGVGLSLQMQGSKGIAACFFGDGAACEGVFHESLNLAATWSLPVLYVCENNQWQAFVARNETMLTDKLASRAAAYGMESRTVDGNDVEAVFAAATAAVAGIRKTGKPFMLETYTYRQRGHYEPDDQSYVDPGELARWKAKDPIATMTQRLLERKEVNQAELDAISARVAQKIEAAAAFAVDSPFPGPEDLTTDVYA
jgi:pyruvate dehydrogenase E1 component alpha subunit